MTPETRKRLEKKLNEHGLSVLLTRDYAAILLQLARLAQFERMMVEMGEADKSHRVTDCIALTQARQEETQGGETPPLRALDILDIPVILTEVHRGLHDRLDRGVCISPLRLHAAVSAFVGILCAEVRS